MKLYKVELNKHNQPPLGYSFSEMGIIPSSWKIEIMNNLFHFSGGFSSTREQLGAEGYCYLHYGDIHKSSRTYIDVDEYYPILPKLNIDIKNISEKSLLTNGDVVFVDASEDYEGVSKYLVVRNKSNITYISGLHTIVAKSKSSQLTNDYKCYCFKNELVRKQFNFYASGMKVYGLSKINIGKIKILIPPLDEQSKIANILSIFDNAIELKGSLLEQKKLQKKGLSQKLLTGKIRLPGFDRKWRLIHLKDVFDRVTLRNNKESTNVLTISAQRGLIMQGDYFNKIVASKILDNYFLLKQGEFAYNKSYSNGYPMGAIKRLNQYDEGVVTTLYICFKLKDDTNSSDYFEQFFEAGSLNKSLTKVTQEGARAHGLLNISPTDFFSIKIMIPTKDEQAAIASILVKSDREISLLKQEIELLKTQKKGLMQLLLTGKVRV